MTTKAVIMAGGFGTRLRPLTVSVPKPMVPLANRPLMEHIVNLLRTHGINDVLSVLYYQPDHITGYFGSGEDFGISMEYVLAAADFGTAGAVRNAAEHLRTRFIIISGDVLTDFDLAKAIAYHEEKKAMATILLTEVPNPLAYGIVLTKPDGRIERFLEKPSWGEVFSDTINTGIYIFEPEALDLIPYRREFDFSKDLFPLMLEKGLPLYGYVAKGYWRDIGNLNEYQRAVQDVLEQKVQISIPGDRSGSVTMGRGTTVSPTAKLNGFVVLGDNCRIGDHAVVSNSILGNNVTVDSAANIDSAVIWDNVTVGSHADVSHDVVCNNTTIGEHVTIEENVFIAEHCSIGNHAELRSNIKLWNNKVVEPYARLSHSLVQEEKWMRELFTDARITGISNVEMNPEFGARLGASLGNALGMGVSVVASRDSDPTSRMMKRSIVTGLMSVGTNVVDLQTSPIPQTRQYTRNGAIQAGFHVRKSINNPHKSDIILFASDGRDITLDLTKKVERFFFGEDIKRAPQEKVGSLTFPERQMENYINGYVEKLDVELIRNRNYKLLVDYSYGSASSVFPYILGRLNCNVLAMNSYIDAVKASMNTYDPVNQDEVSGVMRSLGYQVGFKIDPGAERVALIDERGYWFSSMRLVTVVTKLFLETHQHLAPYRIAVPVEATQEIERVAAKYGVQVVRIKNSHAAMMEATRAGDIAFVGGTRGGFIFTEYMFASDALYSISKILEMLARTGYVLAELDQSLPKRHQARVSIPCPWDAKGHVMRRAMEFSADMRRDLIDGVKIFNDENDTSVLLVPDKEKGEFTVIAEANDQETAKDEADRFVMRVSDWRDE
ncbi:MAG: sugar phosphate nucleotidyltransferase [Candidatus Kapaibacterium sp.]|jgi:mannose-1-phosphate guanylyltransferase/phosphomannomutase